MHFLRYARGKTLQYETDRHTDTLTTILLIVAGWRRRSSSRTIYNLHILLWYIVL